MKQKTKRIIGIILTLVVIALTIIFFEQLSQLFEAVRQQTFTAPVSTVESSGGGFG